MPWSEWSHVVSEFGTLIIKHLPQRISGSPNTLSWISQEQNDQYALLCMSCSGGAVTLQAQHSGDRLNLTWSTHDPSGCAAVGAASEVKHLHRIKQRTLWLSFGSDCPWTAAYAQPRLKKTDIDVSRRLEAKWENRVQKEEVWLKGQGRGKHGNGVSEFWNSQTRHKMKANREEQRGNCVLFLVVSCFLVTFHKNSNNTRSFLLNARQKFFFFILWHFPKRLFVCVSGWQTFYFLQSLILRQSTYTIWKKMTHSM